MFHKWNLNFIEKSNELIYAVNKSRFTKNSYTPYITLISLVHSLINTYVTLHA